MPLWHARCDLHMINLVTWRYIDDYMVLGIRSHLVGYNWAWQSQLEIWQRRKGKRTERYAGMIRRSVAVILSNSAPMSFSSTLRVTLVSFVFLKYVVINNLKAISEAIFLGEASLIWRLSLWSCWQGVLRHATVTVTLKGNDFRKD